MRMRRGRLLLVAFAMALGLLPADCAPSTPALTWSDEFTGPAGASPDQSRWRHETGGTGWGNNELEYYTDNADNAVLDGDGHLVITVRRADPSRSCWYGACRFTSARLTTYQRFSQEYGRFEARTKLPEGAGVWPAFWLLGDDINDVGYPECGEIDIMENLGQQPRTVRGSLHGPGYYASGSYTLPGPRTLAEDFHVFAVDWSPTSVSFSVDGHIYQTRNRADGNRGWVFDHPFSILLNVAVGGDFPGPPNDATRFPQHMVVDYVRVYAPSGTATPTRP